MRSISPGIDGSQTPRRCPLNADVNNSFFEFGVQFTEVLDADTDFERKRKALNAVVALYGPGTRLKMAMDVSKSGNPNRAEAHYPFGCIPQSKWREMDGSPNHLPCMYVPTDSYCI